MRAAARYLKGCEMLERYEGKLSRTVLRRGGASNRLLLSLHAMKSITRTIVRVVTVNKRNWAVTLRPKGIESDYNGCVHIIGNGQTVLGS
jgi:hypothetical protein